MSFRWNGLRTLTSASTGSCKHFHIGSFLLLVTKTGRDGTAGWSRKVIDIFLQEGVVLAYMKETKVRFLSGIHSNNFLFWISSDATFVLKHFLVMKFNPSFKMASKRLIKMCFFAMALISAFFCLVITLTSFEKCILCDVKNEVVSFKRDNGNFLELPNIDCGRNPPFLVVLVTSSYTQSRARMAIRETWGKAKLIANKRVVTYFLLGTTLNHGNQIAVTAESLKYGDIIQKDFTDTYYNLTLKTMMGIEWIHKFCPQSSFVMKTDSDVFVNTYYLIELLLKKNKTTRFFTGFLKLKERPIRQVGSKWYVSKEEYPGNTYPPFCSGTGYVFSTDVATQVYNISESVPFIKLEDVFIGLCLAELNIQLDELHSEQTFFPQRVEFSPCRFKKIATSHFVRPHELFIYWTALERFMDEKCPSGWW
ncbi:beta-1,3-galactosyltransferase 5-like isoform X1 [Varanus komodoensis]|uniref:beta-1,3-galactosyltransferase 5-like isoform X1 n=2 Tax=Varanus komodoensis TaxID=61221 RepID=UPI001CF7BBD5|nr:beta-1,3-galactosyltransferase 5-like isoform X1 [Varanus komodoensis]XP_044297985.1 beta-1,3-galactosyltransferase 5-like isoform X1 [Varanus komodoensis]XP_044297986.1 beta-1,3-galactosyltransferase 5-like isoform X1 [Varanus komodoensis]XP_044297987.1 beta-1,3-galactosyltransferase 5-like isoform X1 [Varanus komodoensis]XP_044297988.1 beta-1,3-galactosyltransferase 5-like isoform X1 [Varanus komodoensis]